MPERKIVTELSPIVDNIRKIAPLVPDDVLDDLFTSTSGQTGGTPEFPFFRLTTTLLNLEYKLIELDTNSDTGILQKSYADAQRNALSTLLFLKACGGFDQWWANTSASMADRHSTANDKINETMKQGSLKQYHRIMPAFVQYRQSHNITNDYFTKYQLEWLLSENLLTTS